MLFLPNRAASVGCSTGRAGTLLDPQRKEAIVRRKAGINDTLFDSTASPPRPRLTATVRNRLSVLCMPVDAGTGLVFAPFLTDIRRSSTGLRPASNRPSSMPPEPSNAAVLHQLHRGPSCRRENVEGAFGTVEEACRGANIRREHGCWKDGLLYTPRQTFREIQEGLAHSVHQACLYGPSKRPR
jgi:hypothetical protein